MVKEKKAWKTKWKRRILSTVLCLGMAIQSLPVSVSAQSVSETRREIQTEENLMEKPSDEAAGDEDTKKETVETECAEIAFTETEFTETEFSETEFSETEFIETEPIQSELVETESAEAEQTQTELADWIGTEPIETEEIVTEGIETEESEAKETEPAETEPAEKAPEADSRIVDTGTTLMLENGSMVTVEGITRDRGQWIAFTAPEEGIYRFGWDYHEEDTAGAVIGYLYSEILDDLAEIPEEPWKEEIKDPLLSYDYGHGFRI